MNKKFIRRLLFIALFTIVTNLCVKAQVTDPGDPGDDPDRVPLDPGSWVLVTAAVGYGLKKWKDAKRSNQNEA